MAPPSQPMEAEDSSSTSDHKGKRPASGGKMLQKKSRPGTGEKNDAINAGGSTGLNTIPRGFHANRYKFTFMKTWKLLSHGIANVLLDDTIGTAKRITLTTCLTNIPWEYGFFYCSPAEWARVGNFNDCHARKVHIKISQFNLRVAFETNASTSNLATLNQNKFVQIGIGLRQHPGIINSDRDYTFDAKNPMKPTALLISVESSFGKLLRYRHCIKCRLQ
ncbi:hypothetical protein HHI36_020032 [Cryptolaemus montrouzieri]|uniref:Coat protein n=1 Tax=Cryptolaemus montrouzieri TaxID=559131 RepID=A0ABD2N909_9CUCU